MNNKEVAHLWANQSRDSAKGSHFFFNGRSIYSYGHHFKIAEHVLDKPGHVFFTRSGYSSTTAKHKSYARQAIGEHLRVWHVADFDDHAANVRAYLDDMDTSRESALKARSNADWYRENAEEAAVKAGEYAELFGTGGDAALKRKARKFAAMARSGELFNPEELAGVKERVAAAKEAARETAKRREAALEQQRQEALEKLAAWVEGETNETPTATWALNLPTRLRIEEDGTRVVTSRGARITARTASLLWGALCGGGDVVGRNLDGYAVREWDGAALTVGCHRIEASELARIAALLDLPGVLPGVAR